MIAGQTEGRVTATSPIIGKGVRLHLRLANNVPFEVTLSNEDFIKYKLPRDLVGRRVRITLELED